MDDNNGVTKPQRMRIYGCEEQIQQTFEGLMAIVESWPGMHFELDGSFVWVDRKCPTPWQLDGMVYDRAGAIEYVELHGECPTTQWQSLCLAISGASNAEEMNRRLRVQLVETGVFVQPSECLAFLIPAPT